MKYFLKESVKTLAAQKLQRTLFYILKELPFSSPFDRGFIASAVLFVAPPNLSERDCKGKNSFSIHQIFRGFFRKTFLFRTLATVLHFSIAGAKIIAFSRIFQISLELFLNIFLPVVARHYGTNSYPNAKNRYFLAATRPYGVLTQKMPRQRPNECARKTRKKVSKKFVGHRDLMRKYVNLPHRTIAKNDTI